MRWKKKFKMAIRGVDKEKNERQPEDMRRIS